MGRLSFISLFFFAIIYGEKMLVLSVDFDVYWRNYNGTIPSDALPTGHGTYIAQMTVSNCGLVPGTLYPDRRSAVSEVHMRKVETTSNIKVLCTGNPNGFRWEDVSAHELRGEILEECVLGGNEVGSLLYIGKIFHEGEWKIGKVFPSNSRYRGLRSWYNGGYGYPVTNFQILMGI